MVPYSIRSEATLSHRYQKSDLGCSLLSYLRAPNDGVAQAQVEARISEELAGGTKTFPQPLRSLSAM
jgi:hypothetical protein